LGVTHVHSRLGNHSKPRHGLIYEGSKPANLWTEPFALGPRPIFTKRLLEAMNGKKGVVECCPGNGEVHLFLLFFPFPFFVPYFLTRLVSRLENVAWCKNENKGMQMEG